MILVIIIILQFKKMELSLQAKTWAQNRGNEDDIVRLQDDFGR